MKFASQFIVLGEFKNNKRHGKGSMLYAGKERKIVSSNIVKIETLLLDGQLYEGEFANGKKHGKGIS